MVSLNIKNKTEGLIGLLDGIKIMFSFWRLLNYKILKSPADRFLLGGLGFSLTKLFQVPKYDRTHVVAEYIFNFFFGSVAVISLHY
jgi:hypothetical protein